MRTLIRVLLRHLGLVIAAVPCVHAAGLAAKVGQANVDANSLPLIALAVVTEGMQSPIERLVIENVGTREKTTFRLGKTFNADKPDYPLARDSRDRLAGLLVLRLPEGTYALHTIEFTPLRSSTAAAIVFNLREQESWRFVVQPRAVNYIGSFVITVPTGQGGLPRPGQSRSFAAGFTTEETQDRDIKWAAAAIPGLSGLHRVTSSLQWLKRQSDSAAR